MTGLAAVANADAGLTDDAERLAIAAVRDKPTPQVWNVLANAFLAHHHEPDAGRAYQQALQLDLDDATALLGYARVMLDAGRIADARSAFDRLLAIDPSNAASRRSGSSSSAAVIVRVLWSCFGARPRPDGRPGPPMWGFRPRRRELKNRPGSKKHGGPSPGIGGSSSHSGG